MASAYYNDFDPYVCGWCENLIKAGLVAPGVVDCKSIKEVKADVLRQYRQVHMFSGICGWSLALRLAGVPDDYPVWTGSCPCQPFSVAGKGKGFADDRHLWPDWFKLIEQCRPPIIFGEQVGGTAGLAWLDSVFSDLEGIGYSCGAANIPAASVGAPHIRQRLYFVAYAPGARSRLTQDSGTDSNNAREGAQASYGRPSGSSEPERGSPDGSGFVANNKGRRLVGSAELPKDSHATHGHSADGRGSNDVVGQADDVRERLEGRTAWAEASAVERSRFDGVAQGDAILHGVWQHARELPSDEGQYEVGAEDGNHGIVDPGYADGSDFWRNVEWVPCTDGKSRPVKSGLVCLVNGVPGRLVDGRAVEGSRTGMLRGFGNAIVPPLAAEFIKSALELP